MAVRVFQVVPSSRRKGPARPAQKLAGHIGATFGRLKASRIQESSAVLTRLEQQGFIRAVQQGVLGKASTFQLRIPDRALPADGPATAPPPALPPSAGSSSDTDTGPPRVPALFQHHGLGPGPAETYRALPKLGRRIASRKFIAARVSALQGVGASAKGLARQQGKGTSTVSRHLDKLAAAGAAVRFRGRWWALELDHEQVAAELSVLDKRPDIARRHERRRILYYAEGASWEDEPTTIRRRITAGGEALRIINAHTGAVLAEVTEPSLVAELRQRHADQRQRRGDLWRRGADVQHPG